MERIVSGPRLLNGAYLIKWAGFPSSANTWEPRSHLPDSVFEEEVPGAGPSFPFEVIATNTAAANAAALAAHKLSLTPKPWVDKSSSESSPEVRGKDEWIRDPKTVVRVMMTALEETPMDMEKRHPPLRQGLTNSAPDRPQKQARRQALRKL